MALRLDTYDEIVLAAGKEIADVVLARVGKLLMGKVRVEDSVARTAQATFMVLAAATGAAQMLGLAQRLQRELAEAKVAYRDRPLKFAASFGVASLAVGCCGLHRGADARALCVAQTADAAYPTPMPASGLPWDIEVGAPGPGTSGPGSPWRGGERTLEEAQADHRRVTPNSMATYREFHRRSIDDREGFWAEEAKRVHWQRPFQKVLDYSQPPFARWFFGGETNLCYNAVDRHLASRGDQTALVWISTEVEQKKSFTFKELSREVNRVAAMMQSLGVKKGDRVIIYMPMIPEAAFAMLACARLGAIHSVVFGGFAAASLAARIDDARPALMITADGGSRMGKPVLYKALVDESLKLAKHPPKKVLLFSRGLDPNMPVVKGRDVDWASLAKDLPQRQCPLCLARVQRAVVHPVHLGHYRPAERRAARRRRLRRGARLVDEAHLLRRGRRDDVHHLRHRLGGRALVHHLRAAHRRHDDDHVRGRADPPRRRRVVEDRAGLQGLGDVLGADGDPRAEEAGPGVPEEVRPLLAQAPVPRRRAAR